MRGTLLVAGTGSDAGKSVLVAGLCRWLARQGVKVAPFKAQNMSLNSFVTLDGAEIGRAQAMQAAAAGIEPAADMNPVLLKPGSDRRSQVVVLGHPEAEADAVGYRSHAPRLRQVALDSLARLRDAYDVVICEGAGSPAEINLRDTDVANMGLARAAGLPVIVVGDIDRGGVFAAMYGTLALLSPADQALISGFVINKFRGAPELLDSGLAMLQQLTGRPVYGVLPWQEGLWLDAEDSLSLTTRESSPATRRVVSRHPRAPSPRPLDHSRPWRRTQFVRWQGFSPGRGGQPAADQQLHRRGRAVGRARRAGAVRGEGGRPGRRGPGGAARVPGHRRRPGLAAGPRPGRCGHRAGPGWPAGARHLRRLPDDGRPDRRPGGIAPRADRRARAAAGARPVRPPEDPAPPAGPRAGRAGGRVRDPPRRRRDYRPGGTEPFLDGCRRGAVWGTSWHGALENDEFRRAFLAEVAALAGRDFTPAPGTDFAAVREARLDALGDLIAGHLDTAALSQLISGGPVPGLPTLTASLNPAPATSLNHDR